MGLEWIYKIILKKELQIGFSQKIKEDILLNSARHCSVYHKYKGVKIVIHHIIPVEKGRDNSFEIAFIIDSSIVSP